MFGEVDDSNIYESFDAFSDGNDGNSSNAEFSFGDVSDIQGDGSNDDFLDMSSYGDPSMQNQGVNPDESMPDFDVFDQPVAGAASQNSGQAAYEQPQTQPRAKKPAKKGGGGIFLLLLIVLAAAAGGLFYYKKFMAPAPAPEQSAGDYFYDQAEEQGAAQPKQEDGANTATVDVNLDDSAAQEANNTQEPGKESAAKAKDEQKELAEVQKKLDNDKNLSLSERAELKKKLDEAKERQLGLGTKRVTIPVSSGGRGDPFVPFNEKIAKIQDSKFDLIAPPTEVPAAEPELDAVVQTKVSGIMYDSARPSAIVNIGGSDYLVHKGDMVNGYQILDIKKTSVTIKYNTNIYQASVGESVGDNVKLNPVSNISKQFGGAYKKTPGNAIQF